MSKIKSFKWQGGKFYVRRCQIINDKNGFVDWYQLVGQKEMFEAGEDLQRVIDSTEKPKNRIEQMEEQIEAEQDQAYCAWMAEFSIYD